MILIIFLFLIGLKKLQNIYPEQIFDYSNNIVSQEKPKNITSVTIARCICHVLLETKGHITVVTALNAVFSGFHCQF